MGHERSRRVPEPSCCGLCVLLVRSFFVAVKATRAARGSRAWFRSMPVQKARAKIGWRVGHPSVNCRIYSKGVVRGFAVEPRTCS